MITGEHLDVETLSPPRGGDFFSVRAAGSIAMRQPGGKLGEGMVEPPATLKSPVVDLENVAGYREEAIAFAGLLRNSVRCPEALRANYELGMKEALASLAESMQNAQGSLSIRVPHGFMERSRRFHALMDAYGRQEDCTACAPHLLTVPLERVTAASVLPMPEKPGTQQYYPVMTLRIITGMEQPTSYYAAPGKVEALPSPGSWFTFPLESTRLAITNR